MSLEIDSQNYFDEVMAFAEKVGLREQLQSKLDYLATYAEHGDVGKTRCLLYRDWAPQSFAFVIQLRENDGYKNWFNGGLIFHGAHDNGGDGSFPTLSVCVNPTDGWSIHT